MRILHSVLRNGLLSAAAAAATLLSAFAFSSVALIDPAFAASGSDPTEFTLANGVRVVVVPDHRVPTVSHMVLYKIGSADEGPGELGLAHYLEHMMFTGSPSFPKGTFDRFVMRAGGAHNATTTQDVTSYFQRTPRNALEQLMTLEADRMENLQFSDAAALNERKVVMEEYRGNAGQPGFPFYLATRAALYGNHPYAFPPIGTEEAISKFDGAKAMAFYRRHYAPQHAIVVIGGDVTEDEVRALAERTYGRVARRDDVASTELPLPTLPAESLRVVVPHPLATVVEISRTYLTKANLPVRDRMSLAILSTMVGNGMLSRLNAAMVTTGLASGTSGNFSMRRASGEVTFSVTAQPGIGVEVLEAAFSQALANVAANGITQSEFDDLLASVLAAGVFDDDNVTSRSRSIGGTLLIGGSLDDIKLFDERVKTITVDEINRIARTLLTKSRNVTGILIPQPVQPASIQQGQ